MLRERAFEDCSSLKEITIPGTVYQIGGYAFDSCTSLETAWLEPGVNNTSNSVFCNCSSLKAIYLPKSIEQISQFFIYGTAVKDIYYEGSESDFNLIDIERIKDFNDEMKDVTIHYNSKW